MLAESPPDEKGLSSVKSGLEESPSPTLDVGIVGIVGGVGLGQALASSPVTIGSRGGGLDPRGS